MIKIKNTLANFASKCLNTYKDYATTLNNINEELGLQNKVASLSNYAVADELTYTIRKIAYANREPNHETICKYLKQAIEDLLSGMDAADVLEKYDSILYDLRNPKTEQGVNMILPYYKIEQTEEGKQFFFAHRGYFNFWNEYLIMNIDEGNNKVFHVLVNRTGRKFSGAKSTDDCLKAATLHIAKSIQLRKPEEMFIDFPELDKYNTLKKGTRVKAYGRKGVIDRATEHHDKLAYIVYIDGQVDCDVLYPEDLEVIDE